ncbi:MAG: hypothetical protein R3B90_16715 [Planctomycetaceae bacterium]
MKRFLLAVAAIAAIGMVAPQAAKAQATASDTQTFVVRIRPVISITAPSNRVLIRHDRTDANQTFDPQLWVATTNNATGASIDWEITPFANGSTQRNARLTASVDSSDAAAAWTMGTATATTDYTSLVSPNADVTASSTGPGDGGFNLVVDFLDTDYSQLPAGDFVSTVVGTITAN